MPLDLQRCPGRYSFKPGQNKVAQSELVHIIAELSIAATRGQLGECWSGSDGWRSSKGKFKIIKDPIVNRSLGKDDNLGWRC